jgi:hypothetical protein
LDSSQSLLDSSTRRAGRASATQLAVLAMEPEQRR